MYILLPYVLACAVCQIAAPSPAPWRLAINSRALAALPLRDGGDPVSHAAGSNVPISARRASPCLRLATSTGSPSSDPSPLLSFARSESSSWRHGRQRHGQHMTHDSRTGHMCGRGRGSAPVLLFLRRHMRCVSRLRHRCSHRILRRPHSAPGSVQKLLPTCKSHLGNRSRKTCGSRDVDPRFCVVHFPLIVSHKE